jgi:hypothetical protein
MVHRLDRSRSRIAIRTEAVGLFSAVAHDLEIEARDLGGEANVDGDDAKGWIECPIRALHVVGVVKRGRVESNVLSAGDVADIERRIRREVLPVEAIRVEGDAKRLTVHGPHAQQFVAWRADRREENGAVIFAGEIGLSLSTLGIPEVKGPLGAFKVADTVRVSYRVAFVAT